MECFTAKAMLTNDTDYNCHIKSCRTCLTNHTLSITPLIISSITDSWTHVQTVGHACTYTLAHTHLHTHTHASMHTHMAGKISSNNQAQGSVCLV